MRHRLAALLLTVALLNGAAPARAEEPLAKPPALSAAPDTKDSYLRNVQSDLGAWKRGVDEFAAKAQASGRDATKSAARQLDTAWTKAKTESDKLATATADGWDRTRASFEAAARAFTDTFNRAKTDPATKP